MIAGEFSCTRVLVPVDFSASSANALSYAVALGSAYAAEVDVLHVWHSDLATPVMAAKEQAKSALRDFVSGLALRGDCVLRRRIDHGDPYLTIQRTAQLSGYDLTVVAGPKPGAGDAESLTQRLLCTLPGPVLLVPAHAKARVRSDQDRALKLERVLVPLVLAGASFEAVRYARSLARLDHASVEVLLTADLAPEHLARFHEGAPLAGVDEHEATEDSAAAVPSRVQATRLDLVVLAGPRAPLGAELSDQRALRLALAQHCPSLCLPG